MPLILGTNSIKDTGYEVANSLRFNDGSTDYLNKTFSSAGNRKTFTFSLWLKRSALNSSGNFGLTRWNASDSERANLQFQNDSLLIQMISGGSFQYNSGATTRIFRDVSAWYHIVLAVDTTDGTQANRVKLYVNGVQETLSPSTNISQNTDTNFNNSGLCQVGAGYGDSAVINPYDGYMAEVVFIDGQALDPTSFGEFDEDSPTIWKPKDVSGLTFGTNGFYLDFENASSLGADVSGNSNNFTVNNLTSVDQTTDTCTNNFCTLNPLVNQDGSFTLSQGNCEFLGTGANDHDYGTMAVQGSGKWYFEAEFDTNFAACYAGFADLNLLDALSPSSAGVTTFVGMYRDDYTITFGGNSVTTYTSVSNGDIFGFALNLDASDGSKTCIIQKNGTTIDTITLPTANENSFLVPIVGDTSSSDGKLKCNFGNPIETLSSGNSDAEGFGNFEYSPTIGGVDYLAICSKNLAEYG